ncbi:unnamed protein product, partial [Scytosiphon promiscuus]
IIHKAGLQGELEFRSVSCFDSNHQTPSIERLLSKQSPKLLALYPSPFFLVWTVSYAKNPPSRHVMNRSWGTYRRLFQERALLALCWCLTRRCSGCTRSVVPSASPDAVSPRVSVTVWPDFSVL